MRGILIAVALAVLASGCGDDGSPADAVPALSQQLDDVDAAISSGRYGAARSALDDLAAEAERASADGTVSAADADAILAAITALDAQLPQATRTPSAPSSSASVEPEEEKTEEPPPPAVEPKPKHAPKPKKHKPPKHGPKPGHGHGR